MRYLIGKVNGFAHSYMGTIRGGRRARRGSFALSLKGMTSSELLSLAKFYLRQKSYRRVYLCMRALVIKPRPASKKLFLDVCSLLKKGDVDKASTLFCEISSKGLYLLSHVGIVGSAFRGRNKEILDTFVTKALSLNEKNAAFYLYVALCGIKKAHAPLTRIAAAMPSTEEIIAQILFWIINDKKSAPLIMQLIEVLVRDALLNEDDALFLRDMQSENRNAFITLSAGMKSRLNQRVQKVEGDSILRSINALSHVHKVVDGKLQVSTLGLDAFCDASTSIVVVNRLPIEISRALADCATKRANVLGVFGVCRCPEGVEYQRLYGFTAKIGISQAEHLVSKARYLSQHIKRIVFDAGTIHAHDDYLEEVFALGLEDALLNELRMLEGVRAYVSDKGVKQIFVVLNHNMTSKLLDVIQALEGAADIFVYFTPDFINHPLLQKAHSDIHEWNTLARTDENSSKSIDAKTLLASVDRKYPVVGRLVMGQGYVSPFSGQADMLLASVATDQNYHAAFAELVSTFSQELRLSAIEVTGKPVPAGLDARALQYFSMPRAPFRDIPIPPFLAVDLERVLQFAQADPQGIGKQILSCMDSIENYFIRVFPSICFQAGQICHYIKKQNIPIIGTMPGRTPILRAVTVWANRYGHRTIDFQALFISANLRYRRSLAHKYCGITAEQVDLYVREMQPKNQEILRIGSLPIDMNIKKIKACVFDQNFADFKYDEKLKYVVFAAQHGLGDENTHIIEVLLSMAPMEGIHVIIKLHPRTSAQEYEALKKRVASLPSAAHYSVVHKENIYKILKIASLVMTQFSNVGMEAAILGLPVLVVNLGNKAYPVDLYEMGMANEAFSPEDIVSGISSLIFDADVRSELLSRQEIFFARNPELKTNDAAQRALRFVRNEIAPTVVV